MYKNRIKNHLPKIVSVSIVGIFAGILAACTPDPFSLGPSVPGVLQSDPSAVKIITSDIDHFWAAYDAGATASDFEKIYFGNASNGLKDFVRVRSSSVNPAKIADIVRTKPKYFASIRPFTLQAPRVSAKLQEHFAKFKAMFPDAKFADVYLMMGSMGTGGTIANNSILIGTELFARDASTPTDELSDWQKQVTKPIDDLPAIICHELIHVEQEYLGMAYGNTLLGKAIQEGGADFVSELFVGTHTNKHLHLYGESRQKELWKEFTQDMNGTELGKWLYNSNNSLRGTLPADLGYYIGYKIVEAYYNKAADKQQALREILSTKNPAQILAESGYHP